MTKIEVLEQMCAFLRETVADLMLPVSVQKAGEVAGLRPAEIIQQSLPNLSQGKKKAPYIIVQIISGADSQPAGERTQSSCLVRFVFCTYSDNEQEGYLHLMNLMERVRIAVLKTRTIAKKIRLNLEEPMEHMVYTTPTSPYYGGEMISTWRYPSVEREVSPEWLQP